MNALRTLKTEMRDNALLALRNLGTAIAASNACNDIPVERYAAAALMADRSSDEKFNGLLARAIAFGLVFSGVCPLFKKPQPISPEDDCGDFDGSVVVSQMNALSGDFTLDDANLDMLLELAGISNVIQARLQAGVPLLEHAERFVEMADNLNELRALATRHVVLGSAGDTSRAGRSMYAALLEQRSRVVPAGNVVPTINLGPGEPLMYLHPLEGISKIPSKEEFEETVKRLAPLLHNALYADGGDALCIDEVAAHTLGQLSARALVGLGIYVGSLKYERGVVVKVERVLESASEEGPAGLADLFKTIGAGGPSNGPLRGGSKLATLMAMMALASGAGSPDDDESKRGKPCCGDGSCGDGSCGDGGGGDGSCGDGGGGGSADPATDAGIPPPEAAPGGSDN